MGSATEDLTMATTPSPKGLLFVKIAAVAFAISACGYIVITGHEKANPPAEAPAPTDGVPAAAGDDAAAAPSKKPDPAFLYSSKSMVISAPTIEDVEELDEEEVEAALKKRKAIEQALMSSSKSFVMPKPGAAEKKSKPAPKAAK
jgi:hypothetical protein